MIVTLIKKQVPNKPFVDLSTGEPIKFDWYDAKRKEGNTYVNFQFGTSQEHVIDGKEVNLKIELFEKNGRKIYKEVV